MPYRWVRSSFGERERKTLRLDPIRAVAGAPTAEVPALSVAGILKCLDDNKAEDIVTIDLHGKSNLTDTMIVCSGRADRHVGAIADYLVKYLKETGHSPLGVEGTPVCDWVLVDAGDVIVHIFRPEVRAFYRLERLWQEEAPPAEAERLH